MRGRVAEKALDSALAGRRKEVAALLAALGARQSRLIVGPAGIGKTRLLQECLSIGGQPFVTVGKPATLHDLLLRLAEGLQRFPLRRHATTVQLKPLVLNALRESPRCVILEDVEGVEPRMYRFLQELYYVPNTCLIATVRSRSSWATFGNCFGTQERSWR